MGDHSEMKMKQEEPSKLDNLPLPVKLIFLIGTGIGLVFVVFFLYGINLKKFTLLDVQYYYVLFGVYGSLAFLILPERKKKPSWYDYILFAVFLVINIYLALHGEEMTTVGWAHATPFNVIVGTVFLLLALEACRRVAGMALPIVALIFGTFPLYADKAPGILMGIPLSFSEMVSSYTFTNTGLLGVPAQVLGGIMMGFLIFAGLLMATGAGPFFLNSSYALLGKYRGGPAKVSVLAAGLFGSLSGGPATNVVATGTMTIPDMKRVGYPASYAGGLNAAASTGGALMPPVMGICAFVMASTIGIPYSTVVIAAIIPSFLFYLGLLVQADLFAAKTGIKGMPADQIPDFRDTFRIGWPFILVIIFLVFGLVVMKWEVRTPFYAAVLTVLLSYIYKENRMTGRKAVRALYEIGKLIAITAAIMMPVGMIIGAITATGVGASFTSGVIGLAQGNTVIMLLIGVAVCYIMGMAGILVAAYIFLAVTLAPVLVSGGFNLIAVHLFIMYFSTLSMITPPVAGASFIAAAIGGGGPIKTSFASMKLGIVIYFIPFFFIFNPALVLQEASIITSLYLFVFCAVGIFFIASGLEGYMPKIGRTDILDRALLLLGGFFIALPDYGTLWGFLAVAIALGKMILMKRLDVYKGRRGLYVIP